MYFSELPSHVKEAIVKLTKDDVFQERFRTDEILDSLDEEIANPSDCLHELLAVLGQKIKINDHFFKHITPSIWSFLWCIESPLVKFKDGMQVSQADIDIFFYLVENGLSDCDLISLATKSFKWCEQNGVTLEEAIEAIKSLIELAFSPLKLFPSSGRKVSSEDQSVFDADWITSLVSKVHNVTGYAPEFIMNSLSLTSCCYYFCQYSRIQGVENIARRLPEEVVRAQDERAVTMILDRLVELEVVKEEDRDDLFEKMTTSPTNK